MTTMKIQMAIYAVVDTRYSPDKVDLEIRQHYYRDVEVGDYLPTNEYDRTTVTKVVDIFEIERDVSAFAHLKAADIAVPGLERRVDQLRADFQAAVNTVQQRIQSYLALPNHAEERQAEAREELADGIADLREVDDNIPF